MVYVQSHSHIHISPDDFFVFGRICLLVSVCQEWLRFIVVAVGLKLARWLHFVLPRLLIFVHVLQALADLSVERADFWSISLHGSSITLHGSSVTSRGLKSLFGEGALDNFGEALGSHGFVSQCLLVSFVFPDLQLNTRIFYFLHRHNEHAVGSFRLLCLLLVLFDLIFVKVDRLFKYLGAIKMMKMINGVLVRLFSEFRTGI